MAYISPTEALTTFLYENWTDTPVCYPNSPEPELGDNTHWVRIYTMQSNSETTLSTEKRVTDTGMFYLDVIGQSGAGTGGHTEVASKLAKLLHCADVNDVSLEGAKVSPVSGYDNEGRYVLRVTVDYFCDYEY